MRRITCSPADALTAGKAQCEDKERGAVSVLVALMMVVLLGFAALAVDVGAVYAEKAQLQNGADAAALAIATDCAEGTCGSSAATGSQFANSNANDNSSGAVVTFPAATRVRVVTNARDARTGANNFSLMFARVLGFQTAQVGATAEATWGSPTSATTLPWTASECVFKKYLSPAQLASLNSTGNFSGDPIPTHVTLRYDTNAPAVGGCVAQNGYQPGGFGWLETNSGCSTDISISAVVIGQPGNHFPNGSTCNSVLAHIMDAPALIPLFKTAAQNGSKTKYTLVGFAAFQVTGYKFDGGQKLDPAAPSCTNNCRAIQGYFSRFVSLDEGSQATGGIPNYGASVVTLTK
ncbi:Tad domain-containing protein [Paenarthrobacter sp. UW852]|uniref:Tad domain-containing protein n=1 Tax=Paenarthrobacter sp. UW852 TaxID=2951989 RepID=UPI002148B714|nr:Tad domain-containing protein [Paenarthrobacter sp. UW852]MCR1163526.1 Tad domain-containing protein [Paenarthrobacter sp. UW852]